MANALQPLDALADPTRRGMLANLALGEKSIGELAEACGFHDPCSFARQFKAWHGETASSWRARNLPVPEADGEPLSAAALH